MGFGGAEWDEHLCTLCNFSHFCYDSVFGCLFDPIVPPKKMGLGML